MHINYFFMIQQRRLRERFTIETLTRHEYRIQKALYAIRPGNEKYATVHAAS